MDQRGDRGTEDGGMTEVETLRAALSRAEADAKALREAPFLTFTLREADQLLGTFGGENALVTVRKLPAGYVMGDDADGSPAGLWAHFTEQPQEGTLYLGPADDPDEEYQCDHDSVDRTALLHAQEWVSSAPHGDNCFVSDHYEGDPGDRCNCGKDSLLAHIDRAVSPPHEHE